VAKLKSSAGAVISYAFSHHTHTDTHLHTHTFSQKTQLALICWWISHLNAAGSHVTNLFASVLAMRLPTSYNLNVL